MIALPQVFLKDIKKSFEGAHWDAKTIEIHLPHYEIPQLSPHYYAHCMSFESSSFSIDIMEEKGISNIFYMIVEDEFKSNFKDQY